MENQVIILIYFLFHKMADGDDDRPFTVEPLLQSPVDASLLCRPSMRLMLEREERNMDTGTAAAVRETAQCHLVALSVINDTVWAALAHFSTLGVVATATTAPSSPLSTRAPRESSWLCDAVSDSISALVWLPVLKGTDGSCGPDVRLLLVGTSEGSLHIFRVAEDGNHLAPTEVWTRQLSSSALAQLVLLESTSVAEDVVAEVVGEGKIGEEGEVWMLFGDSSLAVVPLEGLRSAAAVGAEQRAGAAGAGEGDTGGNDAAAAHNPHFVPSRPLDPLPLHFRWQLANSSSAVASTKKPSSASQQRALLAVAPITSSSLFCSKPPEAAAVLVSAGDPSLALYLPGRRGDDDALAAALEAQIDAGVGSSEPPTARTMAKLANEERLRERGGLGAREGAVRIASSVAFAAVGAFSSWWGGGGGDSSSSSSDPSSGFGTTNAVLESDADSASRVRAAVEAAILESAANASRTIDLEEREDIEAAQLTACRALPLPLAGSLHDPHSARRILSLEVAPGGDVAACTDSLGRALLLRIGAVHGAGYGYLLQGGERQSFDADTQLFAAASRGAEQRATAGLPVLRMWKGKRDARCGWLSTHINSDGGAADSTTPSTCLVLMLRDRGVIEVWRAAHSSAIASAAVDVRTAQERRAASSSDGEQHGKLTGSNGGSISTAALISVRAGSVARCFVSDFRPTVEDGTVTGLAEWRIGEIVLGPSARTTSLAHEQRRTDQQGRFLVGRLRVELHSVAVACASSANVLTREEVLGAMGAALSITDRIVALCSGPDGGNSGKASGVNEATLTAALYAAESAEHACWHACSASFVPRRQRQARAECGVFVYAATLVAIRRRTHANGGAASLAPSWWRRIELQQRLLEGYCAIARHWVAAHPSPLSVSSSHGEEEDDDKVVIVRSEERTGPLRFSALVDAPRVRFVRGGDEEAGGELLPLSYASTCAFFAREDYCRDATASHTLQLAAVHSAPIAAELVEQGDGGAEVETADQIDVLASFEPVVDDDCDGGGWSDGDDDATPRSWGEGKREACAAAVAEVPVAVAEVAMSVRSVTAWSAHLRRIGGATTTRARIIEKMPPNLASLICDALRSAEAGSHGGDAAASTWCSLLHIFVRRGVGPAAGAGAGVSDDAALLECAEQLVTSALIDGDVAEREALLTPLAVASIVALFAKWVLSFISDHEITSDEDGCSSTVEIEAFARRLLGGTDADTRGVAVHTLLRAAETTTNLSAAALLLRCCCDAGSTQEQAAARAAATGKEIVRECTSVLRTSTPLVAAAALVVAHGTDRDALIATAASSWGTARSSGHLRFACLAPPGTTSERIAVTSFAAQAPWRGGLCLLLQHTALPISSARLARTEKRALAGVSPEALALLADWRAGVPSAPLTVTSLLSAEGAGDASLSGCHPHAPNRIAAQCALRSLVGTACAALLGGGGDADADAAGDETNQIDDEAIAQFIECTETDVVTAKCLLRQHGGDVNAAIEACIEGDGSYAVSGEAEVRFLRCLRRAFVAAPAKQRCLSRRVHTSLILQPAIFTAMWHCAITMGETLALSYETDCAASVGVFASALHYCEMSAEFIALALSLHGSSDEAKRDAPVDETTVVTSVGRDEEWESIVEEHGARSALLAAGSLALLWSEAVAPTLVVLASAKALAGPGSDEHASMDVCEQRAALRDATAGLLAAAAAVPAAAALALAAAANAIESDPMWRRRERGGGGGGGASAERAARQQARADGVAEKDDSSPFSVAESSAAFDDGGDFYQSTFGSEIAAIEVASAARRVEVKERSDTAAGEETGGDDPHLTHVLCMLVPSERRRGFSPRGARTASSAWTDGAARALARHLRAMSLEAEAQHRLIVAWSVGVVGGIGPSTIAPCIPLVDRGVGAPHDTIARWRAASTTQSNAGALRTQSRKALALLRTRRRQARRALRVRPSFEPAIASFPPELLLFAASVSAGVAVPNSNDAVPHVPAPPSKAEERERASLERSRTKLALQLAEHGDRIPLIEVVAFSHRALGLDETRLAEQVRQRCMCAHDDFLPPPTHPTPFPLRCTQR